MGCGACSVVVWCGVRCGVMWCGVMWGGGVPWVAGGVVLTYFDDILPLHEISRPQSGIMKTSDFKNFNFLLGCFVKHGCKL